MYISCRPYAVLKATRLHFNKSRFRRRGSTWTSLMVTINAPHFRASIRVRESEWGSTHFDQLDRFFLMKSGFRAHPSFFRGGTAQWTVDIECIHFLASYMYWYRHVQGQINLYVYQPLNCQWGSLLPLPQSTFRGSWTCLTLKIIMKTGPTRWHFG